MKTAVRDFLMRLGLYSIIRRLFGTAKWFLRDRRIIRVYLSSRKINKLHLGAQHNLLQGWLNSDLYPYRRDVIHLDATKLFPFDHCVFDYVFSEHMIEHITYPEGLNMLKECHRILKPGGKIRIATPDLLFLVKLYRPDKTPLQRAYIEWSIDAHNIQSAGSYEDTFVINKFVRDWGHTFIYDERVLRLALEQVGFTNVVRRELHESEDEELKGLENEERMPDGFLALETMVLEATKPEIDI